MTTPDNPSKSEVWGQFPTLSARLDDLDTHVVDALAGGGGGTSRAASAILWTPSLTPSAGDPVSLVWWQPDPTRSNPPGLASLWWQQQTWTLPPVWEVDPGDHVLLLVGDNWWPTVYAEVTPDGFIPVPVDGGTTVTVTCDTWGGPTVWVGQNGLNPATGGTSLLDPVEWFAPHAMQSVNVLVNGGYDGNIAGSWSVADALDRLDNLQTPGDISAVTGEPMGFPAMTDSTIAFDNASRTFTITPVTPSVGFDVWVRGIRYNKGGAESVSVDNVSDLYFISYDMNGYLSVSTQFFNLEICAPTAAVYWNATTQQAELVFDERHGVVMDWRTHQYLHTTRGSAIASGFGLSGYTLGGNGSNNAHAQTGVNDGVFYDEDIRISVQNSGAPTPWTWEQQLAFPAEIPVFYRSGTDEWVLDAATTFPVKQGTARIRYNQLTGGAWTTTDIQNNRYGITWVVATNNVNYPVIGILGQAEYSSQPQADAVLWSSLNLTGLPIAEMRPLWRLVFQTATTMSNTPHASLASISDLRGENPLIIA